METIPVVIIGAGLAGIAAAKKCKSLNVPYVLLEKESRPGGLCRTEKVDKYYFDYTGHLIHFHDDNFAEMVKNIMGDQLGKRYRNAWIYSKNTYTRYPFQMNLYGLPVEIIIECIYEYSKCCFNKQKEEIGNYEDWILRHLGKGIADHFMIPYNYKIFKTHPRDLSQEITGRFVPGSNLKAMLKGALTDSNDAAGYNSEFYYPVTGGIESLVKELCSGLTVSTNENVEEINIHEKFIKTSTGRYLHYQALISTQPIPSLITSIQNVPETVKTKSDKLKWVSVLNVNLGVRGLQNDKHWVYFPEEPFNFHRIGCTHNFSETMAPEGFGSIYVEISYNHQNGINIQKSVEDCIRQLESVNIIGNQSEVVLTNIMDIPFGYVLFENDTTPLVNQIETFLLEHSIHSAGRFGSWQYSSMEDAYLDGLKKTEIALKNIKVQSVQLT